VNAARARNTPKTSATAAATGRHRDEGSLPSGNRKASATSPAKTVGQFAVGDERDRDGVAGEPAGEGVRGAAA
jgi:hypothetical protein